MFALSTSVSNFEALAGDFVLENDVNKAEKVLNDTNGIPFKEFELSTIVTAYELV